LPKYGSDYICRAKDILKKKKERASNVHDGKSNSLTIIDKFREQVINFSS